MYKKLNSSFFIDLLLKELLAQAYLIIFIYKFGGLIWLSHYFGWSKYNVNFSFLQC